MWATSHRTGVRDGSLDQERHPSRRPPVNASATLGNPPNARLPDPSGSSMMTGGGKELVMNLWQDFVEQRHVCHSCWRLDGEKLVA
jgi:hypothetical protein